jgi:hypothetical protein
MQPLEALKQAAIEAKKNLYLPKLIKSANMELCWQGRIIRAHELTNEALAAKAKCLFLRPANPKLVLMTDTLLSEWFLEKDISL